jgi:transposase
MLPSIYYSWLKQFMEGGKARLKGDSLRNATSEEVVDLRKENEQLKEALGEQTMELLVLKKRLL